MNYFNLFQLEQMLGYSADTEAADAMRQSVFEVMAQSKSRNMTLRESAQQLR